MATPRDGYKDGIQRVEIGGASSDNGPWSSSNQGGVVTLGTYLTGERYATSTSSLATPFSSGDGTTVTLTFDTTAYDSGDQVVLSGTDNSLDGTYTITKVSATSGTITSTVTAAATTGSVAFTHLSRGYFQDDPPIVEMTTTQRTGLTLDGSHSGLVVWDTDLGKLMEWAGSAWIDAPTNTSGAVNVNIVNQEVNPAMLQDYDTIAFAAGDSSKETWDISMFDEVTVFIDITGTTDAMSCYISMDGTTYSSVPASARDASTGAFAAATATADKQFTIPFNGKKMKFERTGSTDTFTVSWSARNSGRQSF